MSTDRESPKLNPECGDGAPPATLHEQRAAVPDSHDAKAEPRPFRLMADDEDEGEDAEWEKAMLGVSTDSLRLSIEMALIGFFGFPLVTFVILFAVSMLPDAGPVALVCIVAALALTFIVLLAKGKFALAFGGIAGTAVLALILLYMIGRAMNF